MHRIREAAIDQLGREAAALANQAAQRNAKREGANTWLNELIWRDFYMTILHYFPHVRQGSFRPEYDAIQWRNDPEEFAAWCEGRTGYPFIDAAMRQLVETGWLHNRARMIVASLLVKNLGIHWHEGARWFWDTLVDADLANNTLGWQWVAGCGADAVANPAIAVAIVLTGGLHEDGLADFADGFGAGHDREHILEVMHDSRTGAYGVVALILSVGVRGAALAALETAAAGVAALIAAAALSRAAQRAATSASSRNSTRPWTRSRRRARRGGRRRPGSVRRSRP
mgnify:CR=1 FL=1